MDLKIRQMKGRWHNKMTTQKAPERIWNLLTKHTSKIIQILQSNLLKGRTGYKEITGKTPDISEYCDFDFYDHAWYHAGVYPSISE